MSAKFEFTKENIDFYLIQLAKEYKKINKYRTPIEIVIIGGGAVLTNYSFRNVTYDIDAIFQAESGFKQAINNLSDKLNLPTGWLNSDVRKTESYSPKIIQYSKFYKQFYQILNVRTITGEYLIAMKLKSAREYKRDRSDVVGIINEELKNGNQISIDNINQAFCNLYGYLNLMPESSKLFIDEIMKENDFEKLYLKITKEENITRSNLIKFESDYPTILKESNLDEILTKLKEK